MFLGYREKLIVLAAQITEAVGMLVFAKILAVRLSKGEMGVYFLAASGVALISTCFFSVTDQGFMRFVSVYERNGVLKKMYSALLGGNFLLALLVGLVAAVVVLALGFGNGYFFLVCIAGVWLSFDCIKTSALVTANTLRKRKIYTAAKMLEQGLKVSLLLLATTLVVADAKIVLAVLASSSLVVMVFLLVVHKAYLDVWQISDLRAVLADVIGFGGPLFVWSVFGWVQNMSGRWLLGWYHSGDVVAEFGILASLATLPVGFLLGIVAAYSLPIIYQREDETPGAAKAYVVKIVYKLGPILLAGLLIVSVYHRDIVVLLSSTRYAEYSYLLPYMTFGTVLNVLGAVLSYVSFARHQTGRLVLANSLPGVISLLLGLVIVPSQGLYGAVVSFILAHVAFFLLHFKVFLSYSTSRSSHT